jgi:hypothetical protein
MEEIMTAKTKQQTDGQRLPAKRTARGDYTMTATKTTRRKAEPVCDPRDKEALEEVKEMATEAKVTLDQFVSVLATMATSPLCSAKMQTYARDLCERVRRARD